MLHILSGLDVCSIMAGLVLTVDPGETVLIQPGERHWHGAAPDHTAVHLAMQEADDKGVDASRFEQVTDTEYNGRTQPYCGFPTESFNLGRPNSQPTKKSVQLRGPCAPITNDCSMSAVFDGPEINSPKPGRSN